MSDGPFNGTREDSSGQGREPLVAALSYRQAKLTSPAVNQIGGHADRDGQRYGTQHTPPGLYGRVLCCGGMPERHAPAPDRIDLLLAYGSVAAMVATAILGLVLMVAHG